MTEQKRPTWQAMQRWPAYFALRDSVARVLGLPPYPPEYMHRAASATLRRDIEASTGKSPEDVQKIVEQIDRLVDELIAVTPRED